MAEIWTNEELSLWLQRLNREEVVALAVRLALRATPVWPAELKARADFRHFFLKRTWRAIDVALFAVRRGEERAAVSAATLFPANSSDAYAYAAAAAAVGAAVNAAAPRRRPSFGAFLADLEVHVEGGNVEMWRGLNQDLAALERSLTPEALLETPLWPHGAPEEVLAQWEALKAGLGRFPREQWGVWTTWIEDRFAGRPINWALQRDRVLTPFQEGLWLHEPTQVNARIRRILLEHGEEDPASGLEGTAPPEGTDPLGRGGRHDDHAAARESLSRLMRLASESGVRLKEAKERTQKALEALGESIEETCPGALARGLRRFRSLRAVDDLRRSLQDPQDPPLRPGERLALEDVLGDLEVLAAALAAEAASEGA